MIPRGLVCLFLAIAAIGIGALPCVAASALTPSQFAGLRFEQHPGAVLPLDAQLLDEDARPVRLGDYFGRPVVLVLEYLHCPNLCGPTLAGLVQAMARIPAATDDDFAVVVVSVDPREKPADAKRAKAEYLAEASRPLPAAWHFLTGTAPEIARIAAQVGFRAVYDPDIDQYAHPAGVVVATPDGAVARYFPGIDYDPAELGHALRQAAANRIAAPAAPFLLLCYGYDPSTGKYNFLIGRVLQLAGSATALALGFGIYLLQRRERRIRERRS
jgi:protein SCO1/2